ncbi:hypothetical protein GQ457_15G020110 [Hibiscus cannabinus]
MYVMQSMCLPKGICDEMEKMICQFVWGSTNGSKAIAFVKWETIESPIQEGGLGFRDPTHQNQVLLMKIGFHLITNAYELPLLCCPLCPEHNPAPIALFCAAVCEIYLRTHLDLPRFPFAPPSSAFASAVVVVLGKVGSVRGCFWCCFVALICYHHRGNRLSQSSRHRLLRLEVLSPSPRAGWVEEPKSLKPDGLPKPGLDPNRICPTRVDRTDPLTVDFDQIGLGAPEEDKIILISIAARITVIVTELSNKISITARWRNKVNRAQGSLPVVCSGWLGN